ncbi:MAG: c-type cytochrome [Planctomycetaceae bacterium]|nr:c-type cytochrome [Planctomycetaceae bacterium]
MIAKATMILVAAVAVSPAAADEHLSPLALAASKDGRIVYVAAATAPKLLAVDLAAGKVVRQYPLPADATGAAVSPDGRTVYATCGLGEGQLLAFDEQGAKRWAKPAGHSPMAPTSSPDGKTVYVCDRFNNRVLAISIADANAAPRALAVSREPVAAAITSDGRKLVVANHLPAGAATATSSAVVSIIDTTTGKSAEVALPDGSTSLRGLCVSGDGAYAAVTHILARHHLPTTQLDRGWMNTNALSVIDLAGGTLVNTVLLDDLDRGAANPWGIAWSADGKQICVAHAGTHELSVIDAPAMLAKLAEAAKAGPARQAEVRNDLAFLAGIRRRVAIMGVGPRGLVFAGSKIVAAEYFSDTLAVLEPVATGAKAASIALGSQSKESPQRRGERLFNDAMGCFQNWQSCATCHPDVRADALNWDLLNDGYGNPKNTRSLLLTHQVAPVMISGVRAKSADAVRAGIRHIQMTGMDEDAVAALEAYLRSLAPVPSPRLVGGKLSESAARGEKLFESTGCASCHSGALGTDSQPHDIGLTDAKGPTKFYTTKLTEVWRTAPYLFDGRAATMTDVLTKFNPNDKHGATSKLSKQQLDDLTEYVLSR